MDPHSSAKEVVSSNAPAPPPPPPPAPPPPPPPDWRIAEKLEALIARLGGKDDKQTKDRRKSSKRERPKSSRRKSSGQRSRQPKEDDPDTPPLTAETLALMETHKGLIDMLVEDEGVIFNGLCELGDRNISFAEQISGSLFRIFHCRGRHLKLLTKAIEREVHNSDMATTVLRRNSVSTKIISHFAREIGGRYLCRVLKPLCASIIANPQEELEVDPMQLGSDAAPRRIAANMARLTARCKEVVDTIVNSVPRCPASLRVLCSEIKRIVLYKYPSEDSWREAVCGFIFLRFFCSALVTPEEYGLADFVPPQMRRRLILIAKVIQNLASGVRFGTKEQYLQDMNAFLDQGTPAVHQFYDRMTTPPRLMPLAIQTRVKRLDLLRSLFDLQCLVAIKKTRLFKAIEDTIKTTSEVLTILGKLQELALKLEKCSFIEELIQTDPDFNLRDWSVSPHSAEKAQRDSSLIEKSKVRNFTGEDLWVLNAWNDETIDSKVMQREKTLFRALSSKRSGAKAANDLVLYLMEKLASLYEKYSTVNIHAKTTSPVKANRRKSSVRDSGIKHVQLDRFLLQQDPQFLEFSSIVAMLNKIELRNFSHQDKKVLFINIHNLLYLHITALLGPIASKFKRKFFFKIFKYSIDKCSYSLEDIRDGILRGNVTVDEANKIKHFPKKDGRKQNVLNLDPRVHFALSYMTNSSPRVIFLALDRIDQQLEYAAQKFCTAITIDQANNTIYLPRVFQWYEADFVPKTNHTHADKVNLLRIVRHWITDKQMVQQIEQRLEQSANQGSDEFFRIEFRSFDWLLTPVTDLFDWSFCPTRRNSYGGSMEEPSEEMSEQQSEEM